MSDNSARLYHRLVTPEEQHDMWVKAYRDFRVSCQNWQHQRNDYLAFRSTFIPQLSLFGVPTK